MFIWPCIMFENSTISEIIFIPLQVQKLSKNEILMVNIGSLSSGGRVLAVKADLAKIGLTSPVCTEIGEKIALSRRVEKHWRYLIITFVNGFIIWWSGREATSKDVSVSGGRKGGYI